MKILSIDIGNTNINYAVIEGISVFDMGSLATNTLKENEHFFSVFEHLIQKHSLTAAAFCSVVPELCGRLASLLPTGFPLFQLTDKTTYGLNLAYPKPEEIGHDRIANAIAAQTYYSLPSIIIDLGTAITLDVVTANGYEGGIIAPGFRLMSNYLSEQTALLPKLDLFDSQMNLSDSMHGYGRSTKEAMELGVSIGFSGMVSSLLEHVSRSLKKRTKSTPVVLSTGGSIANLTHDWVNKTKFVDAITLIGLAEAYLRWSNRRSCK